MHVLTEEQTRVHTEQFHHETERGRLAMRVARAQRLQRRADRAAARAQRANLLAVLH